MMDNFCVRALPASNKGEEEEEEEKRKSDSDSDGGIPVLLSLLLLLFSFLSWAIAPLWGVGAVSPHAPLPDGTFKTCDSASNM